MGKFVNNTGEFFAFCEENDVQFVDFRFTDIKGAWHHISYRVALFLRNNWKTAYRLTVHLLKLGNQSTNQICY